MMTFLTVLTFFTGFLVVFGVNLFLADLQASHRQSVRLRLEEEMRAQDPEFALMEILDNSYGPDRQISPLQEVDADVSSTWWQSVNAIFIILLSPVFAWLWIKMKKANKEPSTPFKFAIGLALAAPVSPHPQRIPTPVTGDVRLDSPQLIRNTRNHFIPVWTCKI